jgi:hypothetical protein
MVVSPNDVRDDVPTSNATPVGRLRKLSLRRRHGAPVLRGNRFLSAGPIRSSRICASGRSCLEPTAKTGIHLEMTTVRLSNKKSMTSFCTTVKFVGLIVTRLMIFPVVWSKAELLDISSSLDSAIPFVYGPSLRFFAYLLPFKSYSSIYSFDCKFIFVVRNGISGDL